MPRGTKLYDVIGKLMIENEKLVGERYVCSFDPNQADQHGLECSVSPRIELEQRGHVRAQIATV